MSLRKHPFEVFFEKALRDNAGGENRIAEAAFALANKGYPHGEVYEALKHFTNTLLDDSDHALAKEAVAKFESFFGMADGE